MSTKAGDVGLRIPKLRKGSFFTIVLEPRRRVDQALHAVIMEAYVQGISTRSVHDLVEAMGIDSGISKSEASRICAGAERVLLLEAGPQEIADSWSTVVYALIGGSTSTMTRKRSLSFTVLLPE